MKIVNQTLFPHQAAILYDKEGRESLVLIIKATLRLDDPRDRQIKQTLVFLSDQPSGSGGIRYPSDLVPMHEGTDIICHGHVYARPGRPQLSCRAELQVGPVRQSVVAFGSRRWKPRALGWSISSPEPFERIPLGFEYAFGGPSNRWNPIGMGDPESAEARDEQGLLLPLLEREDQLIQNRASRPAPAGFGVLGPDWEPRTRYAGTYDAAWSRKRAPLLPVDFDDRFFQVANQGLTAPKPLVGGEPLTLLNLTPGGRVETELPRLALGVQIGGNWHKPQLQFLIIEPDLNRLILAYRVAADVTDQLDHPPSIRIVERYPLSESRRRA